MKIKIFFAIACLNTICENKFNNITVIGVGRLGLCTALVFERAGYNVLGIDVNESYVESLNSKNFESLEPSVNEYLKSSKNFHASTNIEQGINFSDIFFIIVATPNGTSEAYDHSHLIKILEKINQYQVKNKHIVICCTIFPGFIENKAKNLLIDCQNITISYNPEFIAQGSIIKDFENPDTILIGEGSKNAGDVIENIYMKACKNTPKFSRMSPASAEIAKLALNCFLTTKIAYANMIGDIAASTPNANADDILKMIGSDSRVGNKYLNYGYGYGGPCFPRDNRALGDYAKTIKVKPIIPVATDESNKYHATLMADKMQKKGVHAYVFTDVNYKPNCNVVILEESQKLAVAKILAERGCKVIIKDKQNIIKLVKQEFGDLFSYEVI